MAPDGAGSRQTAFPTPAQAALGYFLVGISWIFGSDVLISWALGESAIVAEVGMLKGSGFVALSAAVIYMLLDRQQRSASVRSGDSPAILDPRSNWRAELVEASPEGIGIASLDGRALYLNPAGRRLLGVDDEELARGVHISRFYTDEAWRQMKEVVWPAIRREGLWEGETELVDDRGNIMPVHKVLIAHRDDEGMITHVSTHVRDLREARTQQATLRQTADILANTTEGVFVTDTSGRIEWVNSAFTRILGHEADEVLGCSPGEFGEAGFDHETFRRLCSDVRENGHWQGELALRRSNGEVFPVRMSVSAFRNVSGKTVNFSCLISDLTRYKHFESQLSFLANHDPLTGLPNSTRFQEDLGAALTGLGGERQVCVLVLDLYEFQMINESFGRAGGDDVLKEVARRIGELQTDQYCAARLGGDEFGLFVAGPANEISPALEAERVREIFRQPFDVAGEELFLAGNIGVVLAPEDGLDVQTLIRNAEIGVRRAKERGQNVYEFYSDQLHARSTKTIMIASGLRRAINQDAFDVEYQPIIRLADGRPSGVEALARWAHPELGSIPPDQFIDVAERTGLIQALGELVMARACRDFHTLLELRDDLVLAINVSPVQIEPDVFPAQVRKAVNDAGLTPSQIELEITESLMMQDPEQTRLVFQELTDDGFRIAIDDFGTGFSSLSLLKQFAARTLKIDQSFTRGIEHDGDDRTMTRTIIAMAKGLGMATVAEGIETAEQLDWLVREDCELGQGYYFSRPLGLEKVSAFVAD